MSRKHVLWLAVAAILSVLVAYQVTSTTNPPAA